MRKIFLLVAICFGFVIANAQDVYTSSGKIGYHKKTKKKGFDSDKLIIGGGINAAFTGVSTEVGLSPIVGYRFFDHFSAGVGVGYQYYKAPSVLDQYNNVQYYCYENMVYPNVWSRYFIMNNIYASAIFEYDFIHFRGTNIDYISYQPYTENYNITNPCLLFGFGFKQPMGGRVSGVMEIMYDVLQQPNSPYLGQPIFRIGFCAGL